MYSKKARQQRKYNRGRSPLFWLVIVFILLVSIILAVTEFTGITHMFSSKRAVSGTIKTIDSPSPTLSSNKGHASGSEGSQSSINKFSVGSQSSTNGTLLAPYGSLVSNHKPGQNGSNMTELSQCTTTPGATCYIKFTLGDVVKTLPKKTADSSGSIFWEWDVTSAGLIKGNWTIEAVASLGDQTKSTADQLDLEIQ